MTDPNGDARGRPAAARCGRWFLLLALAAAAACPAEVVRPRDPARPAASAREAVSLLAPEGVRKETALLLEIAARRLRALEASLESSEEDLVPALAESYAILLAEALAPFLPDGPDSRPFAFPPDQAPALRAQERAVHSLQPRLRAGKGGEALETASFLFERVWATMESGEGGER